MKKIISVKSIFMISTLVFIVSFIVLVVVFVILPQNVIYRCEIIEGAKHLQANPYPKICPGVSDPGYVLETKSLAKVVEKVAPFLMIVSLPLVISTGSILIKRKAAQKLPKK